MRLLATSIVAASLLMTGCATSFQKPVDPEVLARQQTLILQAETAQKTGKSSDAVKYLEEASVEGSGQASYQLGQMFMQGASGKQDKEKAFQYYSKADQQGNVDGTITTAWFSMYGIGTKKDEDLGLDLMEKAAKSDRRAQREVGLFNANLRHPFLNSDRKGFKYLKKATAAGDTEAPYYLALLAKRTGDTDLYSESLQSAVKRGQPQAMLVSGREALTKGQFMIARDLFEKSALTGDSEGMFEMGKGIHFEVFPPTINRAAKDVEAYVWLSGSASLQHLQAAELKDEVGKSLNMTPEIQKQIQDIGNELKSKDIPYFPNKL